MIGDLIDHYRVLELLGRGAMGIVYKALDTNLERQVAIKVMSAEARNDPDFVERFRQEARMQGALNHPNVAMLFGYFIHDGTPVAVMEFIDGESLEQMIRRRGAIPARECIPLFKQALRGVAAAHRAGIIHRDLKPSNLMLTRDEIVKVTDFGIAKRQNSPGATKVSSTSIGSPLYMAPEQILGRPVDARTDVYALGLTLYELLSGQRPFDPRGKAEYMILNAHVNDLPVLPTVYRHGIPQALVDAVMRALAKDPAERFQSAEEFMNALPDDIAEDSASAAIGPGGTVRIAPPVTTQRLNDSPPTSLRSSPASAAPDKTLKIAPPAHVEVAPGLELSDVFESAANQPLATSRRNDVPQPVERSAPATADKTLKIAPPGSATEGPAPEFATVFEIVLPHPEAGAKPPPQERPAATQWLDADSQPPVLSALATTPATKTVKIAPAGSSATSLKAGRAADSKRVPPVLTNRQGPIAPERAAETLWLDPQPEPPGTAVTTKGSEAEQPRTSVAPRFPRMAIAAGLVLALLIAAQIRHAQHVRAMAQHAVLAAGSAPTPGVQAPAATPIPAPSASSSAPSPAAASAESTAITPVPMPAATNMPATTVAATAPAPKPAKPSAAPHSATHPDLSGVWQGEYVDAMGRQLLRVASLSISHVRGDGGIEGTLQYETPTATGECKLRPNGSIYWSDEQRLQLRPEACSPHYPRELGVPLDFEHVNPHAGALKEGRIEAPTGEVITVKLTRAREA